MFRFRLGHLGIGHDAIVKTKGKPYSYYAEGDEEAPFFSEAYLYALLGKGDVRTVLAMLNNLIRAAGLDPHKLVTRPAFRVETSAATAVAGSGRRYEWRSMAKRTSSWLTTSRRRRET